MSTTTVQGAAAPAAMTWDASGKAIVGIAASAVLAHCIMRSGGRWSRMGPEDMDFGMDVVNAAATQCGILAGTVLVTPDELLAAVQEQAKAMTLPTARLPQPVPVYEPGPTVAGGGPSPPPPPPFAPPFASVSGSAISASTSPAAPGITHSVPGVYDGSSVPGTYGNTVSGSGAPAVGRQTVAGSGTTSVIGGASSVTASGAVVPAGAHEPPDSIRGA